MEDDPQWAIPTRRHGSSAVAHTAPTKPGELGHKTRACPDGEALGARAWQYSNHELIDFTGGGYWSRSQKRDTTRRACLRVMPSQAAVIFDSLVGHHIFGTDWQARQDKHRKVAGLTCVQLAAWEEKTGAAAAARHHTLFGLCSLIRLIRDLLTAGMFASRVAGSANRLSAAQGSLILSARWRRSTRCEPPGALAKCGWHVVIQACRTKARRVVEVSGRGGDDATGMLALSYRRYPATPRCGGEARRR